MVLPISPSLTSNGKWSNEVKFIVSRNLVPEILAWVRGYVSPDPHGQESLDGAYLVRTLYLDTLNQDVLKRSSGYRVKKYRIRRYGCGSELHLECKQKIGERVSKDRASVSGLSLLHLSDDMAGHDGRNPATGFDATAFWDAVATKRLEPATLVEYKRYAFFGLESGETLRLTIDIDLVTERHSEWSVPTIDQPTTVEAEAVIEIKFPNTLPNLFREFLLRFGLTPVGFSKYRSAMTAGRSDPTQQNGGTDCLSS